MNAPKISIILPCYRVDRYLDRCLKTVVNQTLKDIEIILVDDASPDEVPQICDAWSKKDSRIKVIHKKKNEGLGFARNTGLELASGEYIAFIDSDDYVATDIYEKLYGEAVSTQSDIVFCGMNHEISKGSFVPVRDFGNKTSFQKSEMIDLSIRYFDPPNRRKLIMSVWHAIYRKDLIEDISFYSEREVASEDLPFQVMAIIKANKVTYLPDTLYYYCLNESSLSHTFNFEKCFRYYNLVEKILNFYPENQRFHLWNFFFATCQNIIRDLVKSGYKFKDKINCIKRLANSNAITAVLASQWSQLSLSKMARVYCNCLFHKHYYLLYLLACVDVYIVCDKLGIKKLWS